MSGGGFDGNATLFKGMSWVTPSIMIFLIPLLIQGSSPAPALPAAEDRSQIEATQDGASTERQAVSDQALERLATTESRLPGRLNLLIYNDPAMRTEIKRVGFEKGCHAIADSRREVSRQFVPALVPATVGAIRKIVPEPRLSAMRPRSFIAGPLRIYERRIDDEIDRTAPEILMAAYDAMRTAFLARTRKYPTTQDRADNVVMPAADIAAAASINGPYDLDNPAHLGMACIELLFPGRPRITTSSAPAPLVVIPSKQ